MHVTPRLQQVVRRDKEVRTPGELFPDVQRMIVVRHDRLGDLVLSLPAVEALRRAYPDARLGLMVRPDLAPLARMVDGVEVLPAHVDRAELRREIERFEADLIVCISRRAGMSRVAARARVKRRVGTGYRIYSPLFTRTVNERRRREIKLCHGGYGTASARARRPTRGPPSPTPPLPRQPLFYGGRRDSDGVGEGERGPCAQLMAQGDLISDGTSLTWRVVMDSIYPESRWLSEER